MKRTSPKSLNITSMTHGAKVTRIQMESMTYGMNLAKALGEAIPGILVTSTYRDLAKQQYLYDLWKAGKGNRAAKPGTSRHHYISPSVGVCYGAIDFVHPSMGLPQLAEKIHEVLRANGIKFDNCAVERSAVHVDWIYGGGSKNKGALKKWT
jgi:hypothetical protein